jgi:hypothetical protein
MPDPGVTRPDLCSICAVAEQAEPAGAVRGGHDVDGHPPAGDYPPAPPASGTDRAIRLSIAVAVLAAAGIAAYVSYRHAYAVVRAHGETGITARLEPATIDGLVYASSMVVLYAARHRVPVPSLARWLLGLGIAATLTANMAQGWSHSPVGAVVAAWPAVSLVCSYEVLVWLIRASGPAARGRSAEHLGHGAACRAAVHPLPAPASDGERSGGSERGTSDPAWRPASQIAGQSPILAGGQRDDEVLEASAGNDAAVAAYRISVQAGNPLSERRLAQMFGRTSRRWARAGIADARQASPLRDSPGTLVPACADGRGRSAGQALPGCLPGPVATTWPGRSSCARLNVVSWLMDSVLPSVQHYTRVSTRSAAWRPATSARADPTEHSSNGWSSMSYASRSTDCAGSHRRER